MKTLWYFFVKNEWNLLTNTPWQLFFGPAAEEVTRYFNLYCSSYNYNINITINSQSQRGGQG